VAPGRGGQKSQDPRPISDKEYMKTSIHSVINYLTEHHYDRPIAPRVLSSPTTKDFVHILSFLLKAIDPNFKFGGKFEEEVPVIFKSLGYKITINKGPLQSVGAAHSWPQLLAALSWLVELLNVRGRRLPALSRIAPCTTPHCPLTTTPAPAAQYSDAVNGSEPGDGFEDNDDVSKVSPRPLALRSPAPSRRAARARLWAGRCAHSTPLAFAVGRSSSTTWRARTSSSSEARTTLPRSRSRCMLAAGRRPGPPPGAQR
jgi:hypothetical protein